MKRKFPKIIYFLLCFLLIFEQSGFAQISGQLDISGYFSGLRNVLIQNKFRPLHLRYLAYDNINNNFKLLLDKGDFEKEQRLSKKGAVPGENLENSTKELLNYFFIGTSLPNDSFWVNLRPDSPDNIVDPYLAQTDVGKILLEADLQLKKDTSLATSPQTPEGRVYWDKLYKKAEELFGTESITIPTLTRPWIVPGEIIIRESANNAYIYKATLKVMLEQDYLKDSSVYSFTDERLKKLNEYSSQLIRKTIIPKLTKDVNTAKRYAPLRQVYYSLILAQWFKQKFYGKTGLYSYLINKKNLTGLTSKEPWSKTNYFQAYQKSFKEGEYNIKEPVYTPQGQVIRSYMSGGLDFSKINIASSPINSNRPFLSLTKPYTSSPINALGGTTENPFAGIAIKSESVSSPVASINVFRGDNQFLPKGRTETLKADLNVCLLVVAMDKDGNRFMAHFLPSGHIQGGLSNPDLVRYYFETYLKNMLQNMPGDNVKVAIISSTKDENLKGLLAELEKNGPAPYLITLENIEGFLKKRGIDVPLEQKDDKESMKTVTFDQEGNVKIAYLDAKEGDRERIIKLAGVDSSSSPVVYSGIREAVEKIPGEIQKNLDKGAMPIREILDWLQKVYESHKGLLFDFYHNQGHNAGVGYAFLLFLNNLKEAAPRDINIGLLAALLHDFHSRMPEGDRGVPAYVPETIAQIRDLMGIRKYMGSAKKEIPSSYEEKISKDLKNEFRKYLNELFGREGQEDLYNEIEAMILRTDYASDIAQPKVGYKNAAAEIRQQMDILLNNLENLENLEKIINMVTDGYNNLKLKAELGMDKTTSDWLVRQEGIELGYLGALNKVNPQRRKLIHAMSILLEIADQTSFYALLDKEAIETEVIPGLKKEGVVASSEGSYKFFFVPQFLSKPEVLAVLKTLPIEYRKNFVNTMEYFSRLGKALEDWNTIKEDVYSKLGLQSSSSPVETVFSGEDIAKDLSYLEDVARETLSKADEGFKEKVFLLFGTKLEEGYYIKRMVPVLKYLKQTHDYVENDPAYITELIDKYATGKIKLLGVLHTYPYDLTKIITKPGPSWQDRLGEDLLLPERSEKIIDIPLGVVIEAMVPKDISLEGLQDVIPDLNAYLYLPKDEAEIKTIDVFKVVNFKEWIGRGEVNPAGVSSSPIQQSVVSSPVAYFDADQGTAMDLLRNDEHAWIIFSDMLKLRLRNDYYGISIADIFIADAIRTTKEVLSRHGGIGFRLGERSDEVAMVLPGSLQQEEVKNVLQDIQQEIEKEYLGYCIARLPDGMVNEIKGSNGIRMAQRTARVGRAGSQEYITTVFFIKDSGDINGRLTLDRMLEESGRIPGTGEVEEALPPYLSAGAARLQGKGIVENRFESSLREAEIFQRVAKQAGQMVGVEGLNERPQIKEGARLDDTVFSKLKEYAGEFNKSLQPLREFVKTRHGDNAAKQVRLDNGYAAFMRQNLFVILEYAMEKMKSSDSFIFAVRGPPDNFYIITSVKGKWQVTAVRQNILTAEGATFEANFLSIIEGSGRKLRAAGKFPFKVINDFDELGHYFGNQLIKLDNINLLGAFNDQMHRARESNGILDAQSISQALSNASKNISNLLSEKGFDFSVNFEAISVTSDDFTGEKSQSHAGIARATLGIIDKLNDSRKTVEVPANSVKFYSEYKDRWQEVENEIGSIAAKKAKNAEIGLKEMHRNISMPEEVLASSPVTNSKFVFSNSNELRTKFNTYLKNEGLDQYDNLKNLFSDETMEILINDRSAKPVFLQVLEKSDTESLKFRDLEPTRQLLGYQDIEKVKELISSYSALGIGSAKVADELAGNGKKVIVGITDRYTSEEFTLIPNYRVASNRRCYIPLPGGLFLSIKGSGQNSYSNRPAYYINDRKGKRVEGAVGMEEISELGGLGGASLKESGMSMDLGYLPINNKLIGLEDAKEENAALVFSLSLDYHRLSKLPQLIANNGIGFLCERISGALDAIGELDNVADKLHIKLSTGRILKPDQLMLVIMLNMGKAEGYKQNNGLYHETLHDQDVDFTGMTYDLEELIGTQSQEDHGGNKELYLGGISQRVKILLKMLNAKDTEFLFPSPLETLKVLFKGYFENLNEEYLNLLRNNQNALADILQPLSSQYNERWFSVLGEKNPEEVLAEISRLLKEELERRGKGVSLSLDRETQLASSPLTELRGAVQKLHNKKFHINGGEYVISIEKGDSIWDTNIVLRNKDNLEIGHFNLDTKRDAINNGGMLKVVEGEREKGFAVFILSKLKEVFPKNKELVTEIAHDESLKALKNNESISSVPIVRLFNTAGWELIDAGYYDSIGMYHGKDFSEQMRSDESKGEEGTVIARFKPKITQPYLPGFNYSNFASSSGEAASSPLEAIIALARAVFARDPQLVISELFKDYLSQRKKLLDLYNNVAEVAKKSAKKNFGVVLYPASGSDISAAVSFADTIVSIDNQDIFTVINNFNLYLDKEEALKEQINSYLEKKLKLGFHSSGIRQGFIEYLAELVLLGADLSTFKIVEDRSLGNSRVTTAEFSIVYDSGVKRKIRHTHITYTFDGQPLPGHIYSELKKVIGDRTDVLLLTKAGADLDGKKKWMAPISNILVPGTTIVSDSFLNITSAKKIDVPGEDIGNLGLSKINNYGYADKSDNLVFYEIPIAGSEIRGRSAMLENIKKRLEGMVLSGPDNKNEKYKLITNDLQLPGRLIIRTSLVRGKDGKTSLSPVLELEITKEGELKFAMFLNGTVFDGDDEISDLSDKGFGPAILSRVGEAVPTGTPLNIYVINRPTIDAMFNGKRLDLGKFKGTPMETLLSAMGFGRFSIEDNTGEGNVYGFTLKGVKVQPASSPVEYSDKGGIDFRALPIASQPILINQKINANTIPSIPLAELNSEWLQIENMLAAGITPSSERIKEYLQSCCQKQDFNQEIDKVLSCIADMLRLEEERVVSTDLSLKEMLMLLESGKSTNEMQLVLTQITVEAKEPRLMEQ